MNIPEKPKIGIIGFGRLGRLLARHLTKDFKIYVFNRSDSSQDIKDINAIPVSLKEVCSKDVIIISVPISEFKGVLEEMKRLIRINSLVIDVCSVKEYPVKLMREILPETVQILATHPLFGPDSASDSLVGKKIVLCKERIAQEDYKKIKSYLRKKGLVIVETTPEAHDKEIAKSLVLTHFIGRSLIELNCNKNKIDTQGYNQLLRVLDTVKNDTWQLFEDMNKYNKYAPRIRRDFVEAVIKINKQLVRN